MAKSIPEFEAVDLFAGAGGVSSGILQAAEELGIDVKLTAVNHWKTAVNSHALNHPKVNHICEDVEVLHPRRVVPSGHLHLLAASCECTFHSNARGGGPCNEQSRSQPWQIIRWLTDLEIDSLLMENVSEWQHWGPLYPCTCGTKNPLNHRKGSKCLKPIPARKGEFFQNFLKSLCDHGYSVEWKIQNCACFGDPTKRKRLILLANKGRPVVWPMLTHGSAEEVQQNSKLMPYLTARDHVIDWSLEGKSIFNRKKPLSQNTIRRIAAGLQKFGGAAAEPFLIMLRGLSESHINTSATSVDEPIRTVTGGGTHIGVVEPFLLGQQSCAAPSSVDAPVPTIATAGAISLTKAVVKPFILPQFSGSEPKSTETPIGAVTTDGGPALVEPFIVQTNHGKDPKPRGKAGRRSKSVNEPLPTVTSHPGFALAEPFIIPANYGDRKGQKPRTHSLDNPLPTVVGSNTFGVVEPVIVHSTHGGKRPAHSTKSPLPTVTGAHRGEMALVEPIIVQTDQTGSNGCCAQSSNAPLNTVVSRRNMAVVEPILVQTDQCGNKGNAAAPTTEPIKKVVSKQNMGLVEPFLLPKEGYYRGNTPKSVDQPVTTITAEERMSLVQPYVIKYYGTGGAVGLDQPLDTVTTKDRFLLIQPKTGEVLAELDIRFRMLQPHELAAAHSFPKNYVFTGNKGDQTKMIGNSVPVMTARRHAYVALLGNLAAMGGKLKTKKNEIKT